MTNLLPPNASAHEKVMHQAVLSAMPSDRFDEIATYKDPQRCPAYLLTLLAWERGVDEWQADWSEQIKRDVIEAAPEAQAFRGTVHGIKKTLEPLGVQLSISESWKENGVPHHFSLETVVNKALDLSDTILSESTYNLIKRKVNRAKPVRSEYDIKIGIFFTRSIGIAAISSMAAISQTIANAKQQPHTNKTMGLACFSRALTIIQIQMEAI
ncbi:MAG: phage tail protein I [Gammaproteobacteria bacterium]|nr:MAG: phage tail protein I [Gammaproteobacteria bacterium]